jgi:hypothetical protein
MKVIFYLIFLISFSLKLFVGKAQTMKAYSINAIQGQKVNTFYFTSGSLGASISTDVAYFSHGNSILLPICNYAPHSLTLADGNLISTNISSGSIKWFWNDQLISGATGSSISANQSGQYYNSVSYSSSCEIKSNKIMASILGATLEMPIKCWPNPASDYFNIQLPNENFKKYSLKVYSILGQKVFEKDFLLQNERINISNLPTGTYLLQINNGSKTEVVKLQKINH